MDQKGTLELFKQGKDAWNAWAQEMLAEKQKLEKAGDWVVDELKEPQNDPTRDWMKKATAVFSTVDAPHEFEENVDFSGWVFPWDAGFRNATFSGNAGFDNAKFSGEAKFYRTKFIGDAGFDNVTFENVVDFRNSVFSLEAKFSEAKFKNEAKFDQAAFEGYANFENAIFDDLASFKAINAKWAFSLTNVKFEKKVPDFIQANFAEAPRLEDMEINPKSPKGRKKRKKIPARWRALKRLAIQGHDQERELRFFTREIRSARFAITWPWPDPYKEALGWRACARFWFGIVYGITSDYGRSFVYPFLWWLGLTWIFAAIYVGESHTEYAEEEFISRLIDAAKQSLPWASNLGESARCASFDDPISIEAKLVLETNVVREALYLSFTNSSVISNSLVDNFGDLNKSRRAYGCLFDFVYEDQPNLERKPEIVIPHMVSQLSLIQKILSLILIFLIALAIRNMLKMR